MADLVVTATSVVAYGGARKQTGVAGEAITAGQAIYKKAADGRLWKADCTSAAKAAAVGVALNGGAAGQPIAYVRSGGLNPGATVAVGTVYGVTDTAGGIGAISERAAADYVTLLGVAVTASRIALALNASGVAIPA
jgi:predicted transcriptional regulator